MILRSDYGTENCNLAALHIAFRYHHDDNLAGEKSFIYGPSKANVVSQLSIIIIYMHVHVSIHSSVVISYKHYSLTVANRRVVVRTTEEKNRLVDRFLQGIMIITWAYYTGTTLLSLLFYLGIVCLWFV